MQREEGKGLGRGSQSRIKLTMLTARVIRGVSGEGALLGRDFQIEATSPFNTSNGLNAWNIACSRM